MTTHRKTAIRWIKISDWRRRRYVVATDMLRQLYVEINPLDVVEAVEQMYPLNETVRCDCGRRPPNGCYDKRGPRTNRLSWFNWHGIYCDAVAASEAVRAA